MGPAVTSRADVVSAMAATDLDTVRAAAASVVDPEIPALTVEDMGILRDVTLENGAAVITITPTYSGCSAMTAIRRDIESAVAEAGYPDVEVRTVLSPPWTTEWMSARGRRMLEESAIAPPGSATCPRCSSASTTELSRFGTTACKALMVCDSCGEPFDLFKEL